MTDKNYKMGKMIQKYRENTGMTQEAVAELLGVSVTAYGQWERGGNPSIGNLKNLMTVLQLKQSEKKDLAIMAVTQDESLIGGSNMTNKSGIENCHRAKSVFNFDVANYWVCAKKGMSGGTTVLEVIADRADNVRVTVEYLEAKLSNNWKYVYDPHTALIIDNICRDYGVNIGAAEYYCLDAFCEEAEVEYAGFQEVNETYDEIEMTVKYEYFPARYYVPKYASMMDYDEFLKRKMDEVKEWAISEKISSQDELREALSLMKLDLNLLHAIMTWIINRKKSMFDVNYVVVAAQHQIQKEITNTITNRKYILPMTDEEIDKVLSNDSKSANLKLNEMVASFDTDFWTDCSEFGLWDSEKDISASNSFVAGIAEYVKHEDVVRAVKALRFDLNRNTEEGLLLALIQKNKHFNKQETWMEIIKNSLFLQKLLGREAEKILENADVLEKRKELFFVVLAEKPVVGNYDKWRDACNKSALLDEFLKDHAPDLKCQFEEYKYDLEHFDDIYGDLVVLD